MTVKSLTPYRRTGDLSGVPGVQHPPAPSKSQDLGSISAEFNLQGFGEFKDFISSPNRTFSLELTFRVPANSWTTES